MYALPAERTVDWSDAGVWDGAAKGIPNTNAWTLIDVTDYGATGNGTTDDTASIQSAINAAGQNHVVYFPAGTYRFTTISCYMKNRLLLKGAGPTATYLMCYGSGSYPAIRLDGGDDLTGPYTISSGATKGSTSIVVSSVSGLAVGDIVTIYPLAPDGFLNQELTGGSLPVTAGVTRLPIESTYPPRISGYSNPEVPPDYWGWSYYESVTWPRTGHGSNCQWYEGFGQLVEITDISGTTLTFKNPLYYDYSSYSPRLKKRGPFIKSSGVEDMSIAYHISASAGGHIVRLWYASNCWVKNCEIKNTRHHGVYTRFSRSCEYTHNYLHHAVGYAGDQAYLLSFADYNSDHLVYDNITRHGRHHIVFEGGGQGCVIGYNYSLDTQGDETGWMYSDLGLHGRHPYMNLWEGNHAGGIELDSIHGSSSHNVIYRNSFTGRGVNDNAPDGYTAARICVKIAKDSIYHTLMGNVLGYSGCAADGYVLSHYAQYDYDRHLEEIGMTGDTASLVSANPEFEFPWTAPETTMLRHGNYNYVAGATVWNDDIADHALPTSLYLNSKPDWFGSTTWPPIGPDVSGQQIAIPAKARWDAYVASGDMGDLFAADEGLTVYASASVVVTSVVSGTATTESIVPNPGIVLGIAPLSQQVRKPTSAVYLVSSTAYGGFYGTVTLSVLNLPAGASAAFGTNPIDANGSTTLTIDTSGIAATNPTTGTDYNLTLKGVGSDQAMMSGSVAAICTVSASATLNYGSAGLVALSSTATGAATVTGAPVEGFVINHLNTDITAIPDAYITAAVANLHIAFGTASHGSQILFGMSGIDAFLGTGTKYAYNNGGTDGALDLRGYIGNFGGLGIATSIEYDASQSTCWTCFDTATRAYLPDNTDVNVIMWAWCYGVNDGPTRVSGYLAYMEELEADFPDVQFVYMTGRTCAAGAYDTYDATGNETIRAYCIANNKILYDFYDIECYDPDGTYFGDKLPDDACNYDSNANGVRDSNWATAWQSANPTGYFNCESPHSQPVNANLKAYAAWQLWARLAGWGGPA